MTQTYYHTPDSVKEYIKAAAGHSGLSLINRLKDYLPQHASVLELGSGPGSDWEILYEYYAVTGSDNSDAFLKHLNQRYPAGSFLKLDATSMATDQHFDGIYSNKVLHHLKDHELMLSINRQHQLLNPKGIVCHSFWRGTGSEVFKGLLVNYHTEVELRELFESFFDLVFLEPYQEFEEEDSLLLIGRKK